VAKKTAFLRHLVEVLELDAVQVLTCRAEEAGRDPSHRETYDLALARAVAGLPTLVEYALPLLRPGGLFVAYKGREVEEEVAQAQGALHLLGGRLRAVQPVEVPGLEAPRHLVLIEKVAPTPERFPRRPGLPAKRPLG
ncbi:MAG: 16S rRNA (guanine(527)-N(7))-methyltransferase RsmG, partial [Chloroflexia bacterium]